MMPAKSDKQRKAAGAALAAKGKPSLVNKLKGAAKSMLSMSKEQLRHFARKGK